MKYLFVLIFAFFSLITLAQTFTSTIDGDYTDNTTWVGNAPNKTISSGMTVIINHNVIMDDNIEVDGGTLIINSSGSFTGDKDLKVKDGGSVVADGFISAKKLELEDNNTSVIINDSIFIDDDVKLKDGSSLTLNGNAVFDKGLDIEDNSNFISNGTLLVEDEVKIKDDANVTFNGDFRTNKKLKVEDNAALSINANAYIDGDAEFKDNVDITIGPNSIVQVTDELKNKDNSELTINGAFIAENGKENKDNGVINGTGLFQVDGGFDNDGTITGSLDVCNGGGTNPFTGGGVSGSATVCSNGASNFPIIPGAPLPVDLLDFSAVLNENNQVELVWVTASELNNDYFTIERSETDLNFIAIEYIPGAGTTNEVNEYKYTDLNPIEGKSFYKLKQTDFDGKSEAFDMVSMLIKSKAEIEVVLYPNPSTGDNVYLKVPSSEGDDFNVLINDLLGRNFISDLTFIEQGESTLIIIDFSSNLPKGIYLINIVVKGEIITKKLYVD